jgi:hypothetical protein
MPSWTVEVLGPEDLGPFIRLLIAAGNETTRAAIRHGLWTLTEFPQGEAPMAQGSRRSRGDRGGGVRALGDLGAAHAAHGDAGHDPVSRTLLVKGLEFDHAVVLNGAEYDVRNLYVAMTRGSKSLTVLSGSPTMRPPTSV